MVVVHSDGSSGISNPSPRPSILGGSLLWFGLDQNPSSSPQNLLVFLTFLSRFSSHHPVSSLSRSLPNLSSQLSQPPPSEFFSVCQPFSLWFLTTSRKTPSLSPNTLAVSLVLSSSLSFAVKNLSDIFPLLVFFLFVFPPPTLSKPSVFQPSLLLLPTSASLYSLLHFSFYISCPPQNLISMVDKQPQFPSFL